MLSLGILGGNLAQAEEEERGWALTHRISEKLENAEDNWDKSIALTALNNTHNKYILPIVIPYLYHEDPEVRLSATESLRHFIGDSEALQYLLEKLEEDPVMDIRGAAFTILKKWESPETLENILESFPNEKSDLLKQEMIEYLGEHKEKNPIIIDILSEELEKENSEDTILAIQKEEKSC